jgi:hypothetical protein
MLHAGLGQFHVTARMLQSESGQAESRYSDHEQSAYAHEK